MGLIRMHNLKSTLTYLLSIAFTCLSLSVISISSAQAQDLYTTDDYLRGLSDEISDPDYIKGAKQDLFDTEKREKSQGSNTAEIRKALISRFNFEELIRTKYPKTHIVYSKLPTSARILIYDEFKSTKKLSVAKRMIIEKYAAK